MAFYKIERSNAEAVFAGDMLRAIQLLNQLYGQLAMLDDRMGKMTTAQVETNHGLPDQSGETIRGIINNLRVAIEQKDSPADKLRTELG